MSYLRGQERLVSHTLGVYLFNQLAALEWFDVQAPFGATGPLHLLDSVPAAHAELQPNSLAFTSGPILEDEEGELGASHGGLWTTPAVFFLDIYGESQGVAKALASDLKAILTGRLPGTNRYQPLMDYTQNPPVVAEGHYIHFESIEIETPPNQAYKRTWQVVKLTCHHIFNAAEFELAVGP